MTLLGSRRCVCGSWTRKTTRPARLPTVIVFAETPSEMFQKGVSSQQQGSPICVGTRIIGCAAPQRRPHTRYDECTVKAEPPKWWLR